MDILTRDDLKKLTAEHEPPCVSLYLPTHRLPTEIAQDEVRFKNLVRTAETSLLEHGMRAPAAAALLAPVRSLMEDVEFRKYLSDGLAVFRCGEMLLAFRLPVSFEETVVVGPRFHIKPLLSVMDGDERFYVLALSANRVRLLEGTRYAVNELDMGEVPTSLADALKWDDYERQLQFHTGTPSGSARGGGVRRAASFYGSGPENDDVKAELSRYFRRVDDGLHELLADRSVPLVLAGVEYLFPIYHEASRYPHLLPEGLTGNADRANDAELHDRAWKLVGPVFDHRRSEAEARYHELVGTGLASANIGDVVAAAKFGRVESLFVTEHAGIWGVVDPATGTVLEHDNRAPDATDLTDMAAAWTFANNGEVFVTSSDAMPDHATVAAVFRY